MALIGAVLLALAGCSDGDSDPEATPSPPEVDIDVPTTPPTVTFAEGPDTPTQVVYDLHTSDGTEEITIAWADDDFALVRSDGRLLRDDDGSMIFCTSGPTPGEDICWDLEDRGDPFLQGVAANLLAVYGLADLVPDSAEDLGAETIAGRPARCVAFAPSGAAAEASPAVERTQFCYDEETRVGLRLVVDAGDSTQTLEATAFSSPEEGIFEPTAEVQPYPEDGAPPTP